MNAVCLEELAETLSIHNKVCGRPPVTDKNFQLIFLETLRKTPPLKSVLDNLLGSALPSHKRAGAFIQSKIKDPNHQKSAVLACAHARIIGEKEPSLQRDELTLAILSVAADSLSSSDKEALAYVLQPEDRKILRQNLKALENPKSNSQVRTEYNFKFKHDSLDPDIRTKAVVIDAHNASKFATGSHLTESLFTKPEKEKPIRERSHPIRTLEAYTPISEGSRQAGYIRRNENIVAEMQKNIEQCIRKPILK